MLVGPTGGGKTVVLNTLVKAQTTMKMPTKCVTLNPKVKAKKALYCNLYSLLLSSFLLNALCLFPHVKHPISPSY